MPETFLLEMVRQSRSGTRVEGFLEDEELARTALSCHLSMDLLCQHMSDGRRLSVFLVVRRWLCKSSAFLLALPELGNVD